MAERPVQDAREEVDDYYHPLLDDLDVDLVTLMEENVDRVSGS